MCSFFAIFVSEKITIKDMEEFKIRTYGRMELAQMYCPELTGVSAYRKVERWITRCPRLRSQLTVLGYEHGKRSYTPSQVRVIIDALGEP